MRFSIFFNCIVPFIILLTIHAPWWAWLLYVVSVCISFLIGVVSDAGSDDETTSKNKDEGQ